VDAGGTGGASRAIPRSRTARVRSMKKPARMSIQRAGFLFRATVKLAHYWATPLYVHADVGRALRRSISRRGAMLGRPKRVRSQIRRQQQVRVTILTHRVDQQADNRTDQESGRNCNAPEQPREHRKALAQSRVEASPRQPDAEYTQMNRSARLIAATTWRADRGRIDAAWAR
jgi:hypothetical protein